jgi:para-nitrobenzyl esterase
VLPAAPLASFAAGQGGSVPLLIGSNRDEARLFLVAANTIDLIDEPTLAAVAGAYGLTGEALAVYRAGRPGASAGDLLAAVISDWFFRGELRPLIGDAPSSAVADRTHRVWVDFISRGDPGWARYDTARRTTGLLSDTVTAADDPAGHERALWDGIR